jgi:hypothetical protein
MMTRTHRAHCGQLRRFRLAWLALIPVIVLVGAAPVTAQELAATEFSSPAAIAQRLEAVRAELDALGTGGDTAARELLLQLEAALYQHQEAIDYLVQMNRAADAAREALQAWNGLDRPAPYSILFSDQLRSGRRLACDAASSPSGPTVCLDRRGAVVGAGRGWDAWANQARRIGKRYTCPRFMSSASQTFIND